MEKKICTAGRSYFFVFPNGDLYICRRHYSNRKGCLMNYRDFSKKSFLEKIPKECNWDSCDAACDRDWAVKWIFKDDKLIKKIESGELEKRFGKQGPDLMTSNKVHIIWSPTEVCGYDCSYCSCSGSKTQTELRPSTIPELSDKEWIDFFKKIKQEYDYGIITLSGGEPFRKPLTLLNVINELQDKFLFAVTTNLSKSIIEFVRNVKPHNVDFNLSLHPSSKQFNFDLFLGRTLLLKKSGFNVKVNFVAYPEQIYLYDYYNKIFEKYGIEVDLIPFAGHNRSKTTFGHTQQEADYINNRSSNIARSIDVNIKYLTPDGKENLIINKPATKINFSSKCNNHCKDCHLVAQERPKDCIINEIKNIDRKNKYIDLYGGEIFLREDIFEILDEIPKNFKINIYTNARIFNYERYINKLKNYHINSINIPLFSLDKEKFNEFTNVNESYEQTINGIKNLTNQNFLVNIYISKKEIKEDLEMIKSLGINKIFSYEITKNSLGNNVMCFGENISVYKKH